MASRDIFAFPNPVNEVSARVVAAGVVAMDATTVASRRRWLIIPLAYGFVARALSGPTLSPLGQLATRVITPRLGVSPKEVPGSLAVIGPTRMDYEHTITAVSYIAQLFDKILNEPEP